VMLFVNTGSFVRLTVNPLSMKIRLCLILSLLLVGCGQSNDAKEAEMLRKERELLQKERELLAKEKELNQEQGTAASESSTQNNRGLTPSATAGRGQTAPAYRSQNYPNSRKIMGDLVGRTVVYKDDRWNFDTLSEFKAVKIISHQASIDYWESTLDMDLEDPRNGRTYFMRLFVTYSLIGGRWTLQKYDALDYHRK
jgi:hypothetical protein